jgi:hypothetical protein
MSEDPSIESILDELHTVKLEVHQLALAAAEHKAGRERADVMFGELMSRFLSVCTEKHRLAAEAHELRLERDTLRAWKAQVEEDGEPPTDADRRLVKLVRHEEFRGLYRFAGCWGVQYRDDEGCIMCAERDSLTAAMTVALEALRGEGKP